MTPEEMRALLLEIIEVTKPHRFNYTEKGIMCWPRSGDELAGDIAEALTSRGLDIVKR